MTSATANWPRDRNRNYYYQADPSNKQQQQQQQQHQEHRSAPGRSSGGGGGAWGPAARHYSEAPSSTTTTNNTGDMARAAMKSASYSSRRHSWLYDAMEEDRHRRQRYTADDSNATGKFDPILEEDPLPAPQQPPRHLQDVQQGLLDEILKWHLADDDGVEDGWASAKAPKHRREMQSQRYEKNHQELSSDRYEANPRVQTNRNVTVHEPMMEPVPHHQYDDEEEATPRAMPPRPYYESASGRDGDLYAERQLAVNNQHRNSHDGMEPRSDHYKQQQQQQQRQQQPLYREERYRDGDRFQRKDVAPTPSYTRQRPPSDMYDDDRRVDDRRRPALEPTDRDHGDYEKRFELPNRERRQEVYDPNYKYDARDKYESSRDDFESASRYAKFDSGRLAGGAPASALMDGYESNGNYSSTVELPPAAKYDSFDRSAGYPSRGGYDSGYGPREDRAVAPPTDPYYKRRPSSEVETRRPYDNRSAAVAASHLHQDGRPFPGAAAEARDSMKPAIAAPPTTSRSMHPEDASYSPSPSAAIVATGSTILSSSGDTQRRWRHKESLLESVICNMAKLPSKRMPSVEEMEAASMSGLDVSWPSAVASSGQGRSSQMDQLAPQSSTSSRRHWPQAGRQGSPGQPRYYLLTRLPQRLSSRANHLTLHWMNQFFWDVLVSKMLPLEVCIVRHPRTNVIAVALDHTVWTTIICPRMVEFLREQQKLQRQQRQQRRQQAPQGADPYGDVDDDNGEEEEDGLPPLDLPPDEKDWIPSIAPDGGFEELKRQSVKDRREYTRLIKEVNMATKHIRGAVFCGLNVKEMF